DSRVLGADLLECAGLEHGEHKALSQRRHTEESSPISLDPDSDAALGQDPADLVEHIAHAREPAEPVLTECGNVPERPVTEGEPDEPPGGFVDDEAPRPLAGGVRPVGVRTRRTQDDV